MFKRFRKRGHVSYETKYYILLSQVLADCEWAIEGEKRLTKEALMAMIKDLEHSATYLDKEF